MLYGTPPDFTKYGGKGCDLTATLVGGLHELRGQCAGRDISATTLPWFIIKRTVKLLESAIRLWLVEAA
jgi:hypothetical protein